MPLRAIMRSWMLLRGAHKLLVQLNCYLYVYVMLYTTCCSAVVTYLAGTNTISVFRIAKQKGGSISLSDSTVEFPQVS